MKQLNVFVASIQQNESSHSNNKNEIQVIMSPKENESEHLNGTEREASLKGFSNEKVFENHLINLNQAPPDVSQDDADEPNKSVTPGS